MPVLNEPRGPRQASFSPFIVSVVPRRCDSAVGRVADSTGACVCSDRAAFDLPYRPCAPLAEVLVSTIIAAVSAAALLALAWRRWGRRRSDRDRVLRAAAQLRGRLRLAWRLGFVLRSEWVPPWLPRKDVVRLLDPHAVLPAPLTCCSLGASTLLSA